jgi:hypothetical protein
MSNVDNAIIFGSFEHVSFPQFGIRDTVAKIDTGAYSGALHCSLIEERTRGSDGKPVLRFIPLENHNHVTETEEYEEVLVRSSTGHEVKRYRVKTEIVVQGKTYEITIGLSDRSKMQREVLIGRRFLRENNILVDTRINQELDTDGEGGENI